MATLILFILLITNYLRSTANSVNMKSDLEWLLIVLSLDQEIALGMLAYRADLRSLLSDNDMTAV